MVKDYIDKKVLIRSSVQELADKREYLSSNIEDEISEEFDLNHGMFYHHYRNKS